MFKTRMASRRVLALLLVVIAACGTNCWLINPDSTSFSEHSKLLQTQFQKDPKNNLIKLQNLVQTLYITGRSRELSNLCGDVTALCTNKACSGEELFAVTTISSLSGCRFSLSSEQKAKIVADVSATQELRDFYNGLFTLKYTQESFSSYCRRAKEWIPSTGFPRFHIKTDSRELLPAKLLAEIAVACEDSALHTQALGYLVKRLSKIDRVRSAVLDKKMPFLFTAFLLAEFLQSHINKKLLEGIKEQDFSGLLHSLTTYGDIHDLVSYREALRAAQHLKSLGIRVPDLSDKKIRVSGDSAVIRWSFFDVYGNLERPDKQEVDIKVNGVLSRAAVGSVDARVPADRKFDIEVAYPVGSFKVFNRIEAYATQEVAVKEVAIGVTKGADKLRDYTYKDGDTLTCSQDNHIHVSVKLDREADIEYASVYLQHSEKAEYDRIHSGVPLRYEASQKRYTADLDLGAADQISAVNGKYRLVVFFGDRTLSENLKKSVATVNMKFSSEVSLNSILDGQMPLLDAIEPTFRPPVLWNLPLNIVVTVAIVLLTLATLRTLLGLKTNWNLFPSDPKKVLYTYIFWAVCAALYALLIYYWIMEQFMDIVFQLFFLSCLALIFGNLALTNLYQKRKQPVAQSGDVPPEAGGEASGQPGSSKQKAD